MSTHAGKNYTSLRGVNLRTFSDGTPGAVRFEVPVSNPSSVSGEYRLYINTSGALIFDNGSAQTTIGAAGTSVPTWESIFAADSTFTITPDATLTIAGNRATATDVLTITNIAGGSGDCIQITNSGTGKDIQGTSNTWNVTKAGVATVTGLTFGAASTITSTSGDITWTLEDDDATALTIGSSGATSMMNFVTSNGTEAVVFGNNITLTDGLFTATSTSNTVPLFLLQNDTITTFGVGTTEDQGAFVFSSDSLTTGDLIRLQLDESALNGGAFIKCVQTDVAAAVFTVGEGGALTIAGVAGSNCLTVTAGDVVLSDASVTITDADNAASLSVTNNTATTASVVVVAGSGTFTGTTTGSFMTITPSGLTTGTAVYLPVAAMTSGTALSIVAGTATFTTGGTLVSLSSTAAVAGNHLSIATTGAYTGTGMLIMSAGAMTTGVMVSLTSTTGLTSGSLLRLTSSTAGAIATNGAVSIRATGAFTSTSNVGYVDVLASATTAGTVMRIASSAAGQTATELLRVVASGFTTGYTGNVAYFSSTSTTGAANVVAIVSANSTAGTACSITANSLTTGVGLLVTSSGTITNAGEGLVNIVGTGITSGYALKIDLTEATLNGGKYINCYDDTATASVFSVGENGVVLYSDFTEVVTDANVITAAESGSVFFLNSATEFASTLPAPVAGLHFTFIVTAAPSGEDYTITTDSSANIIIGTAHSSTGGDADSETSGCDTVSFVASAAAVGDMAEFWCDGTNWFCKAHSNADAGITFTTAS